jgi:hypothetical protein
METIKAFLKHFSLSNIYKSPISTVLGLLVLYFMYELVKTKIISMEAASPTLIFVLCAFFYGNKKPPQSPQIPYNPFFIFASLFLSMSLFSCKTFRKLPKTQIDTLRVIYEKTIPKDSVSIRVINDTLRHTIIEKQGRATIILEKQKEYIQATAICDTILIRDTLKVLTEKYILQEQKPQTSNWIWIYGALLLAIIAIAAIFRDKIKT